MLNSYYPKRTTARNILIALIAISGLLLSRLGHAEEAPFTKKLGQFTLYTPVLSSPAFGYGYDFVGKEHFLMAETKLVDYQSKLYLTFGGAFDATSQGDSALGQNARNFFDGIPYLGLHVEVPLWKVIHIGGFASRDWELGKNLAGIKTNLVIQYW